MAVLTSAEVIDQAQDIYIQGSYEIALTNSTSNYTNSVSLATVEADEVNTGDGGYARLSYSYTNQDLGTYGNGQPFTQKTANFVHDGSSTAIVFNHVVLIRNISGTRTVLGYQSLGVTTTLTNGNTAKININLTHGAQ